jgi:glycosyltransferase involved in cell wall biosynthesis
MLKSRPRLKSHKKKLLYLTVCDPDLPVTGATVRMGAFVTHLAQFYDVYLVNMAGSGHRVDPKIEERFHDRDNRSGVIRRARIEFSRTGYFLFSPTLYRTAERFLQKEAFDYLLADYGLAGAYGLRLARRFRIPLIYSSHNVEYRMYLDLGKHDRRRKVLAPYVYWAERAACRAAKLVVAISESDRSEYAKWIPNDRIEVIPQGFDPGSANSSYVASAGAPPVILFVGNFRSENNRIAARRIVKEIAPAVLQAHPQIKFQLIGDHPPRDLQGPNIEWLGFVDDLGPYLRRANLVIAPMAFAHGMATKIVTALAFGKTILSTPEGAGTISRKYRQLVVAPVDAFPEKIIELLAARPPVDRGQFAALCDEFSWSSLIGRLHHRIEECCASPITGQAVMAKVCGGTSWQ